MRKAVFSGFAETFFPILNRANLSIETELSKNHPMMRNRLITKTRDHG
jgi:hypothetical protein